jgi:hypothetical protein
MRSDVIRWKRERGYKNITKNSRDPSLLLHFWWPRKRKRPPRRAWTGSWRTWRRCGTLPPRAALPRPWRKIICSFGTQGEFFRSLQGASHESIGFISYWMMFSFAVSILSHLNESLIYHDWRTICSYGTRGEFFRGLQPAIHDSILRCCLAFYDVFFVLFHYYRISLVSLYR